MSESSTHSETLPETLAASGLVLAGRPGWLDAALSMLEPLGVPIERIETGRPEDDADLAPFAGAFAEGWDGERTLRRRATAERLPIVVVRAGPPGAADLARAREEGPIDFFDQAAPPEAWRAKAELLLELARDRAVGSGSVEARELAYAVGHDLRAPLRRILSFLELIQRRYKGRLGPDADEYIGFVMDGGEQLGRLFDDLHAYLKLSANSPRLSRVELDRALDDALAARRTLLERAGATVRRGSLPAVRGHAPSLVRLFEALIDNSVKFRAARPLEIEVGAEETGGLWILRFGDNGIGFDPSHSDRIFEVFQRLHPRTEYPGNGIGLSLVQRIVRQHGGSIWADAVPGEGSTIGFTLRKP